MKIFDGLQSDEKELLLKFPVYISLLAANNDGVFDEAERKEAVQLTDIKTYSSNSFLREYYKEVEKNFEKNILKINKELPVKKEEREESIKTELNKTEAILGKLDGKNATQLQKSMKSYAEHVANTHHTPLEFFLVPFFISGLTEQTK